MRPLMAAALLALLFVGCAGGTTTSTDDPCDSLWSTLEGDRDAAQSFTRELVATYGVHYSKPGNEDGASAGELARERELHDAVDRSYRAWKGAGCG